MDRSQLFPRVVSRSYFNAAGIADVDTQPERFGFLRHLGHDVYSFLAVVEGAWIRNLHQDHLDELQLTPEQAHEIALDNLAKHIFEGQVTQRRVTKTESGCDWSVWLGDQFTSSCIVLPNLYSWSREHLDDERFLVRVPSTQLLFILQYKDRDGIPDFDHSITNITEGSDDLISSHWLILDQSGLSPFEDAKP